MSPLPEFARITAVSTSIKPILYSSGLARKPGYRSLSPATNKLSGLRSLIDTRFFFKCANNSRRLVTMDSIEALFWVKAVVWIDFFTLSR